MFNFFRRSKKDPESTNPKEKDKRNKEKHPAEETTTTQPRNRTDMCKNNTTMQISGPAPRGANVSQGSAVEIGLPKSGDNSENASAGNELSEPDSTHASEPIMEVNQSASESPFAVSSKVQSYANMLKSIEPVREPHKGSGVKPCGHGTIAISPRLHPPSTPKKETSTPPDSPKLFLKRKSNCENTSETVSVKLPPLILHRQDSEEKSEASRDTVTGVMKLRVDVPSVPPSPPAFWKRKDSAAFSTPPLTPPSAVSEAEKKNLINQEAKFQSQLNDLTKQLSARDAEASKLRFQMEELQRDVFAKSAGVDRLQAELNAAHKESECARLRLQHLENDLTSYRQKKNDLEDEVNTKTEFYTNYESKTKAKIAELENFIQELQTKISFLEEELKKVKEEKAQLERDHAELIVQRVSEQKLLDEAKGEREKINQKWEREFEQLRTVNILKEQQLLEDFEWKLREVEQKCKKRLQDTDHKTEQKLQEAYKEVEEKLKETELKIKEVERLKSCEEEARKLRGLTVNQETTIKTMMEQQEQMKQAEESLNKETKRLRNLVEMEKENLQHIQRLHRQDIVDRERQLQRILDQKRTEIAMYWEERLLHECGRLKTELEQLHYEEKVAAIELIKKEKDGEILEAKTCWEQKVQDCLKEIAALKKSLQDKDIHYQHEMMMTQTKTDQDILELRRIMDKIDMSHHDKFEKLVLQHEEELEKINEETEKRVKEVETSWQNQVSSLRTTLELVKEQMERESQNKIQSLIEQHRTQLDTQWENLLHQKSEAVKLVEDEYVNKYKTLEEQFYTQQKSHSAREVELLKTIDSLKNDLTSKDSTIDDLQNNVDTLEGGVQVLNQEIAHQGEQLMKTRRDADIKIRGLQDDLVKLQEQQEQEKEQFRLQMAKIQKQQQTTIDQLQRKCQCLTKLFEEVRARYERRESRQEDINTISDLRQIIAEQEKDLACMNEEKRYFQMKLIALEKSSNPGDQSPEVFADCQSPDSDFIEARNTAVNGTQSYQNFLPQINGPLNSFSIPPTIPECDDCDD